MIGAGALAVAIVYAQGLAVVELLAGVRRIGGTASAAIALPFGLVAHGALALPLRLSGIAPGLGSATAQAALLGLAALVAGRSGPRRPTEATRGAASSPRWRTLEIAAVTLIAVTLLLVAALAVLEPPTEWDVLAIWGFKAKLLGPVGDGLAPLRDPAWAYSHPDYPLAWPFALALDPAFARSEPSSGTGLFGVALLAAAAGSAGMLAGRLGRRAALAAAALVATLPIAGAQAVRGLADLPLAALLTVAVGALVLARSPDETRWRALAAAATAGLVLVKQEGLALAPALALVALARAGRGERRHLAAAFAVAFVVIDVPWLLVRATMPMGADNSFADMTPARAWAGLDRLPEIFAALPAYLLAPADWGALWLLAALALAIVVVDRRRTPLEADLALFLLVPVPLYLAALAADAWEVSRLVEVVLSRLALHLAPLAAAMVAAVSARLGAFGESSDVLSRLAQGQVADQAASVPVSKPFLKSRPPGSGVPARAKEPRPVPQATRAPALPGRS